MTKCLICGRCGWNPNGCPFCIAEMIEVCKEILRSGWESENE